MLSVSFIDSFSNKEDFANELFQKPMGKNYHYIRIFGNVLIISTTKIVKYLMNHRLCN